MLAAIGAKGREALRFLLAGLSTTAFSYLLYLVLLRWLSPMTAYVIAYVAGIAWAYSVNSIWVFRGRWTWSGLAAYPLVYVLQAALSFAAFAFLVDVLSMQSVWAPLVIVALTLPINYVAGRWIVYHTSRRADARENDRS
jgi:putative flippase GtrA